MTSILIALHITVCIMINSNPDSVYAQYRPPRLPVSMTVGIENEIISSSLTVFWQYQKSSHCSSDSPEINPMSKQI